jgi:hypothetical protein
MDGRPKDYKQKKSKHDYFYDSDLILNPLFSKIFPTEMVKEIILIS